MCSNYKPVTQADRLLAHFGVVRPEGEEPPEFTFPGKLAPFIVREEDRATIGRKGQIGLFGLLPHWAPTLAFGRKTYNSRSETAPKLPSFRDAWKKGRRCIVPAEEVYEFCYETGKPVRWAIVRNDGPMGIAGLWEPGYNGNPPSFTMLTVNADGHAIFSRMHPPTDEKRMVVILDEADYDAWLNCPVDQAAMFLQQFPADRLHAFASPAAPRKKAAKSPPPSGD